MSYLKFLLATVAALALVMLAFRLTHNGLAVLFAIGLSLGFFITRTPPPASIGFLLWLALVVAAALSCISFFTWASMRAARPFGAERIQTAATVWSMALALAFHPFCWWLGKRFERRRKDAVAR